MPNKSNLIEYYGPRPCTIGSIPYFRQFNLDFEFYIPCKKPDMEQLVKVWINPVIMDKKLVITPVGTSLEGQIVTGYKLMIIGDLEYKVEYVALATEQSLHTAHGIFPFSGYVVLPTNFTPASMVNPIVIIEDISADMLDCRCIYNNVTLMLAADFC